jgi:hypothetical protein
VRFELGYFFNDFLSDFINLRRKCTFFCTFSDSSKTLFPSILSLSSLILDLNFLISLRIFSSSEIISLQKSHLKISLLLLNKVLSFHFIINSILSVFHFHHFTFFIIKRIDHSGISISFFLQTLKISFSTTNSSQTLNLSNDLKVSSFSFNSFNSLSKTQRVFISCFISILLFDIFIL